MVLRTVAGRRTGEDSADLERWLRDLTGCPPITATQLARCTNQTHGSDAATWFYVEADAHEPVARRRCLSCGEVADVLDSAEHWSAPRMWACSGCGQSIAEVAAGLHIEGGDEVTWVALAVRCVECGSLEGLTDFTVESQQVPEVLVRL